MIALERCGVLFLAVFAFQTSACGLLKKSGGDAGADAQPVDAGAAPVVASNAADITHFADEQKMDPTDATIQAWSAAAHTGTGTGTVVATLPKGATVSKISQRDKYFLVVFDSPKDATKKLEGWVTQDAFVGGTHFVTIPREGGAGDGGVAMSADAGVAPLPAIPDLPASIVETLPANGVCPHNFVFSKTDSRCHRPCPTSAAVCGNAHCSSKCQTPTPVCATSTSSCK